MDNYLESIGADFREISRASADHQTMHLEAPIAAREGEIREQSLLVKSTNVKVTLGTSAPSSTHLK